MARFSVTEPVGTFSHFNVMLFVPTADTRMTAAFAISHVDSAYAMIILLDEVIFDTEAVAVLLLHAEVCIVIVSVRSVALGIVNENCISSLRQRVGYLHRLRTCLSDRRVEVGDCAKIGGRGSQRSSCRQELPYTTYSPICANTRSRIRNM